jgi:hypothetical protein
MITELRDIHQHRTSCPGGTASRSCNCGAASFATRRTANSPLKKMTPSASTEALRDGEA